VKYGQFFTLSSRRAAALGTVVTAVLGALVGALAGCGSVSHPAAKPAVTVTVTAKASSSSTATPKSTQAAINEREFADGLASSTSAIPPQLVAGTVMDTYIRFEQAFSAAEAAVGNPEQASTVSPIPGGYQLCGNDGSGCDDLTGFTTNMAGLITGVSVNGQPVSGRIAAAHDSNMQGLAVSDVISYRLTGSQNIVAVTFKIHDLSYQPINNNPAALATFDTPAGQVSADISSSALPSSLSPGETVYGFAAFDTSQVTGTLELRSNDGYNLLLGSAILQEA
jgi:hypothetical protein